MVKIDFQPTFWATDSGVSDWHLGHHQGGEHTSAVKVDGSLDLLKLVLDERIGVVTVSVVVCKRLERISFTALRNEPTRGLRSEPEEQKLSDSGSTLENGGDTPRPTTVGHVRSNEGRPGSTVERPSIVIYREWEGRDSHDRTEVPKRVIERREGGAVGRISQLCDLKRTGILGPGNSETDHKPVHL